MHPQISAFVSDHFYDGMLEDGPGPCSQEEDVEFEDMVREQGFNHVQWFDTAGLKSNEAKEGGKPSYVNRAEAEEVVAHLVTFEKSEVMKVMRARGKQVTIGIITPYRAQEDEMKRIFDAHPRLCRSLNMDLNRDIGTVDAFQGQERDIVILSTVRANLRGDIGFLKSTQRINVSLSRAKSFLWVFGHSVTLGQSRPGSQGAEDWTSLYKLLSDTGRVTQLRNVSDCLAETIRNHLQKASGKMLLTQLGTQLVGDKDWEAEKRGRKLRQYLETMASDFLVEGDGAKATVSLKQRRTRPTARPPPPPPPPPPPAPTAPAPPSAESSSVCPQGPCVSPAPPPGLEHMVPSVKDLQGQEDMTETTTQTHESTSDSDQQEVSCSESEQLVVEALHDVELMVRSREDVVEPVLEPVATQAFVCRAPRWGRTRNPDQYQ